MEKMNLKWEFYLLYKNKSVDKCIFSSLAVQL